MKNALNQIFASSAKILVALGLIVGAASASASVTVRGFNLSEDEGFLFDAATSGAPKFPAQIAVDHAKRLGANHIILNVRGKMIGPKANIILTITPQPDIGAERQRIRRLADYIHSLGMTVGIRPIVFVVGPNGEFPYIETLADGSSKTWWHGNIQPSDPFEWFVNFKTFLDVYITAAQLAKADEFTIGAELYSMTVGLEDQWKEQPYGFPAQWLELLNYVKGKFALMRQNPRIMYDINFTDDSNRDGGIIRSGGEFERWRYRIVDLQNATDPAGKQAWIDLVKFWQGLDAIGIDVYRSLANRKDIVPSDYKALVDFLKLRTLTFASQMDNTLTEISMVTGQMDKPVIFKEIGFRSVQNGFIDPFAYFDPNVAPNVLHQAAAYQAILEAFWDGGLGWFAGINFWDISVNPARTGPKDAGFSPVGKKETEELVIKYYTKP